MISIIMLSFIVGLLTGGLVERKHKKKAEKLIEGTVPIGLLISDFEEFARNVEGGQLSVEAQSAIKVLKTHAEQKYLNAPKPKVKKAETFPDGQRTKPWSDVVCFEEEMKKAEDFNEVFSIVKRWSGKYYFTQSWQTWCLSCVKDSANRSILRDFFDNQ